MAKTASSSRLGFICVLGCVVGLAGLGGCGGDDTPANCSINVQVSGAANWTSGSQDPACLIPFGGSTVQLSFRPLEGDVLRFDLEIKDLKEGQTGTFQGSVEIELRDRRRYETAATACTFRIDEQVFEIEDQFRKRYLSAGSGECSSAAMPASTSATGSVTIAPFTFRSPTNY